MSDWVAEQFIGWSFDFFLILAESIDRSQPRIVRENFKVAKFLLA